MKASEPYSATKYAMENFVCSPNFELHEFVQKYGLENLDPQTRRILKSDAQNWLMGYEAVLATISEHSRKVWLDAIPGLVESVATCKEFIADCEKLENQAIA